MTSDNARNTDDPAEATKGPGGGGTGGAAGGAEATMGRPEAAAGAETAAGRMVVVHPDADLLARAAGTRLLLTLLDAQSVRRPVHVALTGGSIGIALLKAAAEDPLVRAVDWTGVHLWWGDERYLRTGDSDRNETQARDALIDDLPAPGPHIHPMPGPDRVPDLAGAARAYADDLAAHAGRSEPLPEMVVTILGVGPDGHVASLFPGKESVDVEDTTTVAETDSPKPPPERLSLTLSAINTSRQVWLVAAGEGKAAAVAAALTGGESPEVPGATAPAGLVHGRDRTLWLLDAAAAGGLTPE